MKAFGAAGLYGKMPCLGDFVTRGLPDEFIGPWDDWLQKGLFASQKRLSDDWQEIYLNSPLWRFVLPDGLFGASGWAGVLMPSVDRVGRCFPLTLAAALPKRINLFQLIRDHGDWFARAEDLLLSTLDYRPDDLEHLWAGLAKLSLLVDSSEPEPRLGALSDGNTTWVALSSVDAVQDAFLPVLEAWAGSGAVVWWSSGSQRIPPGLMIQQGPLHPEVYTRLLDGRWQASSLDSNGRLP